MNNLVLCGRAGLRQLAALCVAFAALPALAHNPAQPNAVQPVPMALQVRGELAPLADTPDLKFGDFFKRPVGPRGLEATPLLRSLDGHRVRIVGYMVRQDSTLGVTGRLVLAPLPVTMGEEDESFADDLPASAIYVHLAEAQKAQRLPHMPGLMALTGTLHAADMGITYSSKDGSSATSFVVKNIGSQITTYYQNGDRENLPWDLQLGFSKKLAHAPLRLFVTTNHLNKWNLSYLNRPVDATQVTEKSEGFTSLLMRHFIFGAEILPEQHVTLRFGYNYQRQKELSVSDRPGLVGFSAGVGVRIAKFSINYAIASYHLAATVHYFSLAANLSQFIR